MKKIYEIKVVYTGKKKKFFGGFKEYHCMNIFKRYYICVDSNVDIDDEIEKFKNTIEIPAFDLHEVCYFNETNNDYVCDVSLEVYPEKIAFVLFSEVSDLTMNELFKRVPAPILIEYLGEAVNNFVKLGQIA